MSEFLDRLSVVIDDRQLAGWKVATITRSLEAFPSTFVLEVADPEPDAPDRVPMQPGKRAQVYVGGDLLLTGYVDRVSLRYQPGAHDVTIIGRGLCQDLIDCSADLTDAQLTGGQLSAVSFYDLAQKLATPFGVKVKLIGEDKGPVIPAFSVALGETPWEIIERVARYAEFLIYEDEAGDLVLSRLGTKAMATGIYQGVNVERAEVGFSLDQRFSKYIVVWNPLARFADLGEASNQRAIAEDNTMPRLRPKIIVSEQITPEYDLGLKRAQWEMARRIGRSQAVSATVAGWRDDAGELWSINRTIPIDLPALKLPGRNAEWIIGAVTFRTSLAGSVTDLLVMPPDAFKQAPSPLLLFDWQIDQGARDAGLRPPT